MTDLEVLGETAKAPAKRVDKNVLLSLLEMKAPLTFTRG